MARPDESVVHGSRAGQTAQPRDLPSVDRLLRESAAILGDAIEILGQDRKLSAQVLPDSPGPGRWAE